MWAQSQIRASLDGEVDGLRVTALFRAALGQTRLQMASDHSIREPLRTVVERLALEIAG